jgi:hypothetical protein
MLFGGCCGGATRSFGAGRNGYDCVREPIFLDRRSGRGIRTHLRADSVVVRSRAHCGIVLALGDRSVDHISAL